MLQSGLGVKGDVRVGNNPIFLGEWTRGLLIWTCTIFPHELVFGVELGPGVISFGRENQAFKSNKTKEEEAKSYSKFVDKNGSPFSNVELDSLER